MTKGEIVDEIVIDANMCLAVALSVICDATIVLCSGKAS